jgi:CRISPR-associated protein Cas5d
MFHGFDYPDEHGGTHLQARFWRPTMVNGVIRFLRPDECSIRKPIREMSVKHFGLSRNLLDVDSEVGLVESAP